MENSQSYSQRHHRNYEENKSVDQQQEKALIIERRPQTDRQYEQHHRQQSERNKDSNYRDYHEKRRDDYTDYKKSDKEYYSRRDERGYQPREREYQKQKYTNKYQENKEHYKQHNNEHYRNQNIHQSESDHRPHYNSNYRTNQLHRSNYQRDNNHKYYHSDKKYRRSRSQSKPRLMRSNYSSSYHDSHRYSQRPHFDNNHRSHYTTDLKRHHSDRGTYTHYNQRRNNNSHYYPNKRSRSRREYEDRRNFQKKAGDSYKHHTYRDQQSPYKRRSYSSDSDQSSARKYKKSSPRKSPEYSSRSQSSEQRNSQSSSSATITSAVRSNGDAGHFKYQIGSVIGKYRIDSHLGDGTFGRTLKCLNIVDNKQYAVKVIRAVKRYNESAKIEADILHEVCKQGGMNHGIVLMKEYFTIKDKEGDHMCIVFETLAKSLYDFIKFNKYKGFSIAQIQSIGRQSMQALDFLHKLKLTHTDLKPENILLKSDEFESLTDKSHWPTQVINKSAIYSDKFSSDSESESEAESDYKKRNKQQIWYRPLNDEVKLIDFGGATFESEHHTTIINTRQYRAPEVILGCCQWDMKSDIWSMACILVELYTGEMFFATHENLEHLAMIEKQCGPIPYWMAKQSKEFSDMFDLHSDESTIRYNRMRMKWPKCTKSKSSVTNVNEMRTLRDLTEMQESRLEHGLFRQLIDYMLQVDPKKRPSAEECLRHPFFTSRFEDETRPGSGLQNEKEYQDVRQSKSTEKTYGSNWSTISTNVGQHSQGHNHQSNDSLQSSQNARL